ncbi:vanadium-dependent haloperoxidase [uncultured Paraglaciecola sp.]|uniref:vanadium-dependent haloperoxidase n=1 Tax=uncultured Paraglaciecola sp. TaxID=1765024 RepID=UPI0026232CE0|nr:vanadium-dependent haloperoxidase [uncultured Paraglaciecola sp.]
MISIKKSGYLGSRISYLILFLTSFSSQADVVSEWNIITRDIVVNSKLYTPPANRVMAIVHTAVYASVNSITQEYPHGSFKLNAHHEASVEAAVAAASYTSLLKLLPNQQDAIKTAYLQALSHLPEGKAKQAGAAIGKKSAELVLAARNFDGAEVAETYRPYTRAGVYVPTAIPAVPHWPNRMPWLLNSPAQFRPGPPPALNSKEWAKDYEEVKLMGAKNSSKRNQQQTDMAKFWEATLPPIYHGVVHSVANQAGRSVTQNARLFAKITQAIDDAMLSVFDAKYHYGFWRPITAIRNGDIDGNDATEKGEGWTPFIPTPMHPEYPCAHCVVAGTVGAILKAEVGNGKMPLLTTNSDTAKGATRSWSSIEAFVQEVSDARIYDGVHYRTSTDIGSAMGEKIGEFVVEKYLKN